MTKRRRTDLPDQDDESTRDLIQEFRDRLRAPSTYVTGSRPSTTHHNVHRHYSPLEQEVIQLRRLLAKAIPVLEKHSNAKEAQLQLPPEVLENVLSCCDGLTQVHIQLSGRYLRDLLAKCILAKRIPKALIRLESASLGVGYKHSDTDSFDDYPEYDDLEWEFVARARLAGSSVDFIYAGDTFSTVAAQLAARIQSAYVANFTVSSEFLAWERANLPDFLIKTDTASDVVVDKLHVLPADYYEQIEFVVRLGRYAQLVLDTFKEVRGITVGEWVYVDDDSEEGEAFFDSFLSRCLDHGIADVDIRTLGMSLYAPQAVHFCLADNPKLDKKQRNLSVGRLVGDGELILDSFREVVETIFKEVAAGRVKHGFVLRFHDIVDPIVMDKMNWIENENEFAKDFADESTLRVKCRNERALQSVTVTFSPK